MITKFDFDTAEKEPCKVCPLSVYRSPRLKDVISLGGGIVALLRASGPTLAVKAEDPEALVKTVKAQKEKAYVFSNSEFERILF